MKRGILIVVAGMFVLSFAGCGMFKCLQKEPPVQEKIVAPAKVEPVKPPAPMIPKKDRN